MDAQALTNEEVNCQNRKKVGLGLFASTSLAMTIQRGSLHPSKLVLGNGVIWMHWRLQAYFRQWRDFTMRCQLLFRFAQKFRCISSQIPLERLSIFHFSSFIFFLKSQQGVCQSMKRLGGRWWSHWKAVDGDKFVCFDSFDPNDCLVYTFGIRWICVIGFCQFGTFSNDWSFEDMMARLNCTVI